MADAIAVPQNPPISLSSKFLRLLPGLALLTAIGFFTKDQNTSLVNLSRWAFVLTFAGAGLRTNFRQMRKQGLRPFVVGVVG
jgi:uncharacterized membrane protein YadS